MKPAFLDALANFLCFTGIRLLSASTVQLMRIFSFDFTVGFSVMLLNARYTSQ